MWLPLLRPTTSLTFFKGSTRMVAKLFAQFDGSAHDTSQIVEEIISTLVAHSVAEVRFYPAVKEYVDGGEVPADRAYHEQADAERLMAKIDDMDPDDPELKIAMHDLEVAITAHVAFEETDMFPRLRAVITSTDFCRPRPARGEVRAAHADPSSPARSRFTDRPQVDRTAGRSTRPDEDKKALLI